MYIHICLYVQVHVRPVGVGRVGGVAALARAGAGPECWVAMSPYDRKVDVAKHDFPENEKLRTVFFFNYLAQFQKMKIANSTQLKMMKNCICKFSLSTENCRFSACMCTSEACTKKHEYRHFCSKRWFEKFMGLGRAFCFSWNWVWPAGNHNSKEQAHICCEFSCPD